MVPGTFIADMHGRSLATHERLNATYEVRCISEFLADGEHRIAWVNLLAAHDGSNKCLTVVSFEDDEGFVTAMYHYDANTVGICKLRRREGI